VLRPLMSDLMRNVFGGSPARALQCLLDSAPPDLDELAKIRDVIREAEEKAARTPEEGR
jgi:BlaI family penicillinase repressor